MCVTSKLTCLVSKEEELMTYKCCFMRKDFEGDQKECKKPILYLFMAHEKCIENIVNYHVILNRKMTITDQAYAEGSRIIMPSPGVHVWTPEMMKDDAHKIAMLNRVRGILYRQSWDAKLLYRP